MKLTPDLISLKSLRIEPICSSRASTRFSMAKASDLDGKLPKAKAIMIATVDPKASASASESLQASNGLFTSFSSERFF